MGCVPCKTSSGNSYKYSESSLHTEVASREASNRSSISEDVRFFNVERRINLESYQLVWLGDTSSLKIENLRGIVDYTTIFDNLEECQYFLEETRNITTFLIISFSEEAARLAREHLRNIRSVYIYNPNKENSPVDHSKSSFEKTYSTLEELLANLTEHVQEYKRIEIKGTIGMSTNGNDEKTTELATAAWWIHFIDILVHLPYPEKISQEKLIESLKTYYVGNPIEMRKIEEFERTYHSDQAIWWYTRDTFLYRLLNKALRQHNIDLMFLFGFFVCDFYRKLKVEHEQQFILKHLDNPIIKVYRGQTMLRSEIEDIGEWAGSLVVNSCFSTTLNRSLAMIFLNRSLEPYDQYQSVLFEIEIDTRYKCRPYADISHLSQFPDESEILFTIGTQFRIIDSTYHRDEKLWIVRLKLMTDEGIKNEKYFEKRTVKNCAVRLHSNDFNGYCSLEERYKILDTLGELFPTEKWVFQAVRFSCQAKHQCEIQKNPDEGLVTYNTALQIWLHNLHHTESNCYIDIAQIHSTIAWYYRTLTEPEDESLSMKHANLSIMYYQSAIENTVVDDYELIHVYEELSYIFRYKMKSSHDANHGHLAAKYEELHLQSLLLHYSNNDLKVGRCREELARIYKSISNYDAALFNYDRALEIYLSLGTEIDFQSIYRIVTTIIPMYIKYKHDYDSALKYALIMHEHALKYYALRPQDDTYASKWEKKRGIADSYDALADVCMKIDRYDLAVNNFRISIKLHKENESDYDNARISVIEKKLENARKCSKAQFKQR